MRFADKTVLYIPTRFISMMRGAVSDYITSITKRVGGVTIDDVRGAWVMADDTLCVEPMSRITWWHEQGEPAIYAMRAIVGYMLHQLGEEAVLVEVTRAHQTQALIITAASDEDESW